MKLATGEMFRNNDDDVLLFTANNVVMSGVTRQLVMGGGAAHNAYKYDHNRSSGEFRTLMGIDCRLGALIYGRPEYLLAIDWIYDGQSIGAFQAKYHYKDPSTVELIQKSTNMLKLLAEKMPTTKFSLNFPGIGLGGLKRDDVLPILTCLPDNVRVWEYGK